MDTLLIVLLCLIIGMLLYILLTFDKQPVIPAKTTLPISTKLQTLPTQTLPTQSTGVDIPVVPLEVLASGYPLEEEYYYDPAIYYDPLGWYYFGNYASGRYASGRYEGDNSNWNRHRQYHDKLPTSGDITHGLHKIQSSAPLPNGSHLVSEKALQSAGVRA